MWIYFCLTTILLILIFLLFDVRKPPLFPPGPSWLPFIGCYHAVKSLYAKKKFYHLVWAHYHEIYGPVIGLKLGCQRIVSVSGYEAVRQVMLNEVFEGRPDGFFFRVRSFGKRLGVVFAEGALMHEQRKFSLNQLRSFGLGKAPMYDIITNEALEIVTVISKQCKEGPIQIKWLFAMGTLNALWTMIAGYRFSYEDAKLKRLLELVYNEFHEVDVSGGILNQMPFLRFLAPSLSGYNTLMRLINEILDFLQDIVNKHQELNGNNFISNFLREIYKTKNNKDSTFTEKQLLVLLEDLFMAGTETTSSTLTFIILYLIKYPDVQKKIHMELDRVVDPDEIPCMEHHDRLIFLESVIMEVQRHGNPVPISIPHKALENADLLNYKIPKGTVILPSIRSIHMDESYWKNPHEFIPERFISENGKLLQSSHFMPFGIGRRRCIGEVLAKPNLLLFISILLHKFTIEFEDQNASSVEILDGVTLTPASFAVKFTPRG